MFLNLTPTPKIAPMGQKIAPKGPKKCKRGTKCGRLKQKDRAVLPKPNLIVYLGRSQKRFLNLTSTPKKVPKGPKSAKRPKIWPNKN